VVPSFRFLALLALIAIIGCQGETAADRGRQAQPSSPRLAKAAILDLAWEALHEEYSHLADTLRRPDLDARYRDGVWYVTYPHVLSKEVVVDHAPHVEIRDVDGIIVRAAWSGLDA
jgi:hypothetical protein